MQSPKIKIALITEKEKKHFRSHFYSQPTPPLAFSVISPKLLHILVPALELFESRRKFYNIDTLSISHYLKILSAEMVHNVSQGQQCT